MKTLVLVVFLSWAGLANAQSSFPIVIACFGTPTVCAQKIGGTGMTITARSDHANPAPAVASALPQESQVLLADTFRWEARPLAKVPQIPVMIARNEKAKQGSRWGKPVE